MLPVFVRQIYGQTNMGSIYKKHIRKNKKKGRRMLMEMNENTMKRMDYFMTGIGFLLSIVIFLISRNNWMMVNCCLPYVVIPFFYSEKRKKYLKRITFFLAWVTVYNLAACIAFGVRGINLYDVEWNYFVQYFLPFLISFSNVDTNLTYSPAS